MSAIDSRHLVRCFLLVVALLTSIPALHGQLPQRWQSESNYGSSELLRGVAISPFRDLDADGSAEILVASAVAPVGGDEFGTGIIELLDGASGEMLLTYSGLGSGDGFGHSLVVPGDLNGDGWPDIVVGIPGWGSEGELWALDGNDGSLIWNLPGPPTSRRFGYAAESIADLDGDDVADLVVSAVADDNEGGSKVYVVSGSSGQALSNWLAPMTHRVGIDLANLGDLNGNGSCDIAVTGSGDSRKAPGSFVFVVDSATGQTLFDLPVAINAAFQARVAAPGDLNGDGFSDLLLGVETALSAFSRSSELLVLSGADGSALMSRFLTIAELRDVAAGDLDGDGHAELLASTGSGPFIFNGRSLREQSAFRDTWLDTTGTQAIAVIRDMDGDGLGEFVFGENGSIKCSSLLGISYGGPGGGAEAPLKVFWEFIDLDRGLHGNVYVKDAQPQAQGALFVGLESGFSTPSGAPLYMVPDFELFVPWRYDTFGRQSFYFGLAQPALDGTAFLVQAAQLTDNGLTTSNLMRVLYGPGRIGIDSITPLHASAGDVITLEGFGLDRPTEFFVGGVLVTPTAQTYDQLTFVMPTTPSCSGPQRLILRAPILVEEVVAEMNPVVALTSTINASGPAAGGSLFGIFGGPFDDSVQVDFGGVAAQVDVHEELLIVTVPPGTVGTTTVRVSLGSGCELTPRFDWY